MDCVGTWETLWGFGAQSPEYRVTSRKDEEPEILYRESDMLIVVMKPGNAGGAKEHAPMCKFKGNMSQTQIWRIDVNEI